MINLFIEMVREEYRSTDFIPLHAPIFSGREREYVLDTIDSTYVSSVGAYVDRFEQQTAAYVGCPKAVATVNGTAALHIALLLAGVQREDLVITQPLTFVATCNAIAYCGATPIFVDVDQHTLGLSPQALDDWLNSNALVTDAGVCIARESGRTIRACLPMHTFGHPVALDALIAVCSKWHLALIEDAAESLGSLYHGRHTGTFGMLGTLSFNGNKIITTGGGGMVLADAALGLRAKHLTTTAKLPHSYEFVHDEIGYNFRLPNLNAALGCAQLEQLESFVESKRRLAAKYQALFANSAYTFIREPEGCRSNYWLNGVVCEDRSARDALLEATNSQQVMTRPIWTLMTQLRAFAHCDHGPLDTAEWLSARVVNLPSSVVEHQLDA